MARFAVCLMAAALLVSGCRPSGEVATDAVAEANLVVLKVPGMH